MTIQLGQAAPDFEQDTTAGRIPRDDTPVCTTELGEAARLKPAFDRRGVKPIGPSVDTPDRHGGRERDLPETRGQRVNVPMIADADRTVSDLHGMVHPEADAALTVRTVFVIDPAKGVRLMLAYPPSTGRNFSEIPRVIDSLQLTDRHRVATPVNWRPGERAIILPSISDEDAKQRFPQGWEVRKPYLRSVELVDEA